MIRRKHKLEMPELNTTSTADISFMLLIFFLVVSSMDIDKGLTRQLPPMEKEHVVEETFVNKEHLLPLEITENDQLLIDGQAAQMKQLRSRASEFILKVGESHLISIDAHPSSTYDTYFHVQNELIRAYKDVRNTMAMRRFGKSFDLLTNQQKVDIRERIPQHIAEKYHTMDEKGGRDD